MRASARVLLCLALLARCLPAAAGDFYCPEGFRCPVVAQNDQGPSLEELGFAKTETQADPEEQARLDKRSSMLKIHQRLGLITTIPLALALFTGPGGHASQSQVNLHAAIGATAATMYLTTAGYAIFAPAAKNPPPSKGPTKIHKALAWVHFPFMILTPILGGMAVAQRDAGQKVTGIASFHQAAAGITIASYLAAMGVIVIKF